MNRHSRGDHRQLTPREREVLGLVVSRLSNKEVGGKLGINEVTVKAHRGQLMRKIKPDSLEPPPVEVLRPLSVRQPHERWNRIDDRSELAVRHVRVVRLDRRHGAARSCHRLIAAATERQHVCVGTRCGRHSIECGPRFARGSIPRSNRRQASGGATLL